MSNLPKVSIITFVYVNAVNGRLELFKECLDSIKIQQYPNYEHIIIDDGSDVELEELVKSYPNTKYIKKLGSGILSSTYTFNMGHQIAEGKYCIYLPSDDLHFEDTLQNMVNAMEKDEKAQIAIGKAIYEYSDGRVTEWTPNKLNIETKMGIGNYVNGCAVMWRKTDELLSLLPPHYTGFCSDYDIWCTLIKLGKVIYPDVNVVKYRQADDSTRNKTRSRLITSPRKPDNYFFQYSKPARLEFVKDRYNIKFEDILDNSGLPVVCEIDIHKEFILENIVAIFEKRDWLKLHEYFNKNFKEYKKASDLLNEFKTDTKMKVFIKNVNISSIVLMQKYKNKFFYDVECTFDKNSWYFEFLPIPYIKTIVNENGKVNTKLMNFLGLNDKLLLGDLNE